MFTSKHVTGIGFGNHKSNFWKQAYKELNNEDKGKEKLQKLDRLLTEKLQRPGLKLQSEEGYQLLRGMINDNARQIESRKDVDKTESFLKNMKLFQDIVAAGAGAGGPYVAIPVAALFSAFAVSSSSPRHQCRMLTWYQDGRDIHDGESSHV